MSKKTIVRITDPASVVEGAATLVAFSKSIRDGIASSNNKQSVTISVKDMNHAADMLDAAASMIDTLVSVVESNEPLYGVFEPEY